MAELKLAVRAPAEAAVEFIVVRGVAAVLNGAPVNTFDLDVVHARNDENVARLAKCLESLDAVFRIAGHLAGPGHLNLVGGYGPIDVLGIIGGGLSYHYLLPHSTEMEIGEGLRARVLDLETLIAIKEALGGEKDRAVLLVLRRTLEEKRKP